MIVVQTIRIGWTKKSRGGRLAELRNSVPSEFLVPTPANIANNLVWHDISFHENDEFDLTNRGKLKCNPINERFGTKCGIIEFDASSTSLTYCWLDGAPARTYMDPFGNYVPIERRIEIGPNQWASIQYNGRFSAMDCGNWWYECETVNVGITDEFVADLFTATKPIERYSQLGNLW